jgi:hypothetical protein
LRDASKLPAVFGPRIPLMLALATVAENDGINFVNKAN